MEERVGFKPAPTTTDMKIYSANSEDAKWFKKFCDMRGLKFNAGISVVRQIVESYFERKSLESQVAQNAQAIDAIIDEIEKLKTSSESSVSLKSRPKTFGGKL